MFDPTFDELEQIACGEVGLDVNYFYSITPREFTNILIGYRNKEEAKEKAHWVRSRLTMYYALLPYTENKKFAPEDVFKFPWEEETESLLERKPKTREELEEVFKKLENNQPK